MMLQSKVLIVTPAYNAERYLNETILSVVGQTHRDWKMVVVDDGSEDKTSELVSQFAADPRIHLLKQKNQGVAAARNQGLDYFNERFDYVAFLDSDDLWEPNFLVDALQFFKADPLLDVVVLDMLRIDAEGEVIPTKRLVKWLGHEERTKYQDLKEEDLLKTMLLGGTLPPCRQLFNAKNSEVLKGFDPGLHGTEDSDLLIRIKLGGGRFYQSDIIGCRYRQHSNNATKNVDKIFLNWSRLLDKHENGVKTALPDGLGDELCLVARCILSLKSARKAARGGDREGHRRFLQEAEEILPRLPEDQFCRDYLRLNAVRVPGSGVFLKKYRLSFKEYCFQLVCSLGMLYAKPILKRIRS